MKLQQLGFTPLNCDTSLVFLHNKDVTVFILVYVDDFIVASSSQTATATLLKNLEKEIALKDLRDLHFFLGIDVSKISEGILLSQQKYAMDLVKRAGMNSCKTFSTPISTSEKLSSNVGDPLGPHNATSFRSIVGVKRILLFLSTKSTSSCMLLPQLISLR
jgi:hypothetical protein